MRAKRRNGEDSLLKENTDINYVDPKKIARESENYLICFSLFDIKNLLDIKPKSGTYIYSSSEAFEEETEFDFVRINNWIQNFKFNINGFKIVEETGKKNQNSLKDFMLLVIPLKRIYIG